MDFILYASGSCLLHMTANIGGVSCELILYTLITLWFVTNAVRIFLNWTSTSVVAKTFLHHYTLHRFTINCSDKVQLTSVHCLSFKTVFVFSESTSLTWQLPGQNCPFSNLVCIIPLTNLALSARQLLEVEDKGIMFQIYVSEIIRSALYFTMSWNAVESRMCSTYFAAAMCLLANNYPQTESSF